MFHVKRCWVWTVHAKRAGMPKPDLRNQLATLLDRYELAADAAEPLGVLLELLALEEAPTSVHDPGEGIGVHIADALAGLEVADLRNAGVIADLGAGAGLPGLVLAAVLPRARVFLVESVARKCEFLRSAAARMALTNAEVVWARAEEWRDGLGRCDAVCARALAALPVLCEYAAPLLREGGVLVAWKGAVDAEEAGDTAAAAEHLGLAVEPVRAVVPFPGSERRTLHVVRKIAPTPPRYPRRPGMATKRPLTAKKLR
jgi:16S rRNA (guanine527-N7)-methyltransferase